MYLGIDVGGTFIKYALIDEAYQIRKKWKRETPLCRDKDSFYDFLCEGLDVTDCSLVGVSAPGVIIDSQVMSKGAIRVQIMCGTDVRAELEKRLHIRAAALNDAKCAGFCEFKMGAGRGTDSSAYFVIGTGIGGCVCDRNGVIQGRDGVAGEFSTLPFGWAEDGLPDCLSNYASMSALIRIYNELSAAPLRYGTEICERWRQEEPAALKAMDRWVTYICYGLNQIILMFNPDVICLGGGISEEDWFVNLVRRRFRECGFLFDPLITTRIEQCAFHSDANLLGAVLYAALTV